MILPIDLALILLLIVVAGLLFSNQTGGGDKVLAEFKNATRYITLQGDKIFCNNTSDNTIKQLDLTNNNAGYKMSGKIAVPSGGLVVENTADANLSFTVFCLLHG